MTKTWAHISSTPANQHFIFAFILACETICIERNHNLLSLVKEGTDSWLWRPSRVPQSHALCRPSVGDNKLSCQAATLSTVCGEEETGEDDLQGMEAEVLETPPEWKRESGSKREQRKRPRQTSKGFV